MSRYEGRSSLLEVLTAAEMRRWDQRAIEELGIPARLLMESAGRAAAGVIQELYPEGRIVAVVGKGNNGGDAIVALRALRAWGRDVGVVAVSGEEPSSDLLHGWAIDNLTASGLAEGLRSADVIVDGILGTGATGALRDPIPSAIREINQSGRPVVALDGPTGVDLDTGRAPQDAVRADVTITFGAPKRGLLLFPGRKHAGRVVTVEIGLPPLDPQAASAALVTPEWVNEVLPARDLDAHKGRSGTVAIIAGHPGMGGAAILVAMGALRAGAGKIRNISPEANRIPLQVAVPEGLFVDRDGEGVEEVIGSADALVVGPGMGTDEASRKLLELALTGSSGPLLLDADAVTMIAAAPELLASAPLDRVVLTPHPGEMSRLLGIPTREVLGDLFAAAELAAKRFGCVVLLKASPSLIAAAGEATLLNVAGHSGIATSGMGDTLAGVIGALLGRGVPPRFAAAAGVHLAGRAAELAGRGRLILPRDVAEKLPEAFARPVPSSSLRAPGVRLDLAAPA